MSTSFDAIVVGARVAGVATAYNLARLNWRVALVERKTRPLGRTLSLPITHPRGLARFRELGLLPAIEPLLPRLHRAQSYRIELPEVVIAGEAPAFAGFDYGVILRRELLDDTLLEYALRAYPQNIALFEGANTDDVLREADGLVSGVKLHDAKNPDHVYELRAPLVIGADGRFSSVARYVGAQPYNMQKSYTTLFYSYCTGVDLRGLADIVFLSAPRHRLVVCSPIGDDMQTVSAWFPVQQFAEFQRQPAAELRATWESVPALAERMHDAHLVGQVMGLSPNTAQGYFRATGGPGWALVGDARHFKDPASGQGLHDALYSVQQLLRVLSETTGSAPLTPTAARQLWPPHAARMQRRSDRALQPMYAFTYRFAESMTRPPSRLESALFQAVAENPAATHDFLGIMTGATDVRAFYRAAPQYLMKSVVRNSVTNMQTHRSALAASLRR